MGQVTDLASDKLGIKKAVRDALKRLATAIDTNIANIAANVADITNYGKKRVIEEISDNITLDADDSGKVFLVGTNAKVITLPATAEGLIYTFINSGADGNNDITLSPNANDAIYGTIPNSTADSVSGGADDKDFVNTKNTANKGDRITIVGDGDGGWYIASGVGIWASEG